MEKIPSELVQAIQAGDCVLWSGAGIGALAGRPGWAAALTSAIERCAAPVRPQLRGLIDGGRLRPVLSYVVRHCGEEALAEAMRGHGDRGPVDGAELLAKLPWRACFATAYAEVLQAIYASDGQAIELLSHREIHRPTLRPDARDDERPLILRTPPAGRSMRADRALFDLVQEVARTRTIFFFGFAKGDPDFAELLELLGRIGRGRRHYAWLADVTEAEAEELLDSRNIEVVSLGAEVQLEDALHLLHQAIWENAAGPSTARVELVAFDLARAVAHVPERGDIAADVAFACDIEGLDRLVAELAEAAGEAANWLSDGLVEVEDDGFDRIDVSTLLRLGNVYLARGRTTDARRCFKAVRLRGAGPEYQAIALFNLALAAASNGLERLAVSGLRSAAEADRSLSLLPERLELEAVRTYDPTRLVLGGRERRTGEAVELWLRTLGHHVGVHDQRRFYVEVQRAAELAHPGIQRLRGGFTDGQLFGVIADPLPGFTLEEALGGGGRMEMYRSLRLAMGVLDAVAALHAHGMVHRDIRPAQIVLSADGPVLCGQGFSPLINFRRPTLRHLADGYIAPELLAGEPASPTSDVYSVAAVLYRALSGRSPSTSVQPASAFQPDLDPRIDEVLAQALHPDPGLRLSPRRLRSELAGIVSVPMILVSRLGGRGAPTPAPAAL
ncbi:MAG: protein kinase [Myxococcales bacterium]|nr:protein kinase [Myxococcales bacterium]